jgi:hypothetical protein
MCFDGNYLLTSTHGTVKEKTDPNLEALRNISQLVPIGMCVSVHYIFLDVSGDDVQATTTEPSTSIAPLNRRSNQKPRSRDLHRCYGHETMTGHGCRKNHQKECWQSILSQ